MTEAVLDAALRAAMEATGAGSGWIVAMRHTVPVVVAVAGDAAAAPGDVLDRAAPAAIAATTGQPSARSIAADDRTAFGAGASRAQPSALLTVPVGDGGGAIELAHAEGGPWAGASFTIDHIEIVSLLADVVAAAIDDASAPPVVPPDELAAELARLYAADRARYALVAQVVSALVGNA